MQHENNLPYILIGIVSVLLILGIFQSYYLVKLNSNISGLTLGNTISSNTTETAGQTSSLSVDIIPKGIPEVYGAELGVAYDDVSPDNQTKADSTIAKLGKLDTELSLSGDLLKRYINIAGSMSCEYCCGTASIIFTEDNSQFKAGDAACGCAHSYAMRGLAKYLLINHADEFTDAQILEELGKWKVLFFPDIMKGKAEVMMSKGIELTYINMASNKYRGIEN